MDNYEDTINLPHHIAKTHPRLSIEQRAAQFAPFAALTGYEDEINLADIENMEKYDNIV